MATVLCLTHSDGCHKNRTTASCTLLSDSRNTMADLVYQTDQCVSRLFILLHLFYLYCLCLVIVVPVRENLVDYVCLCFCLSCLCHV